VKSARVPLSAVRWPALLAAFLTACGTRTLDAGSDVTTDSGLDAPHGLLPVDERNPVILSNDGTGNWYGLYSILFANTGGPRLGGIAINTSAYATNLNDNLAAWQALVTAARDSGLRGIPEPIGSVSVPLVRPSSGNIDATTANGSNGAQLIVDVSAQLAAPGRPVVVAVGGRLTDVADAYLLDPTVTERVVVVASLGSGSANGAVMGAPNGELDPWADWIVTERFQYVQVSAYYAPTLDLPSSELANLPDNALGAFVASEQPSIADVPTMADQVAVLAAGLPTFVTAVERAEQDPKATYDSKSGPALVPNDSGPHWLVTGIDAATAGARLRQLLRDPKTYGE